MPDPAESVTFAIGMYRDKCPMTEISARTGLSRARIRGILIGSGEPQRGSWRKRPVPSAAEVAERYSTGESIGALAKTYSEDWDVIAGILDGAGVTIRGHGEAEKVRHARRTPEERAAWAQAVLTGKRSAAGVAARRVQGEDDEEL